MALKANLSGETKGMDRFRGDKVTATAITWMFLGPELIVTAGERFAVAIAADFPVLLENTELQAVPDFRARASLSYRF